MCSQEIILINLRSESDHLTFEASSLITKAQSDRLCRCASDVRLMNRWQNNLLNKWPTPNYPTHGSH